MNRTRLLRKKPAITTALATFDYRNSPQVCRRRILGTPSASGDSFEIRYVWLGGIWWTAQDQIAIKLFTTDNDLISGTPTTFATLLSGTSTTAGTYEAASGSATATATEARKRLFVAIDTQDGGGELDGVARLDNFQLQVTHFPEPGLPRLDDFQLQGIPFPDPPPPPTAEIIIGESVRNGDFNGN